MTIICDSYSYSHKPSVRLFTPRVFATRHEHAPQAQPPRPRPAHGPWATGRTRGRRGGDSRREPHTGGGRVKVRVLWRKTVKVYRVQDSRKKVKVLVPPYPG